MFAASQSSMSNSGNISLPRNKTNELGNPPEADETHNYSYSSDHSSSPMPISPKRSTRTLIDFWNNPHESGMTVSFSQYAKSSNGSCDSGNRSCQKSNSTIHTLSDSDECDANNSTQIFKEMLLDVTYEDNRIGSDDVDETESTTECPDDSITLHHDPPNDDVDSKIDKNEEIENHFDQMPPKEEVAKDEQECKRYIVQNSDSSEVTEDLSILAENSDIPTNDNTRKDEPSQTCNTSIPSYAGLPPLPPRNRRKKDCFKTCNTLSRDEYIAKVVENRLPDSPVHHVPFVDTSLSTIEEDKSVVVERTSDCDPITLDISPTAEPGTTIGPYSSMKAEVSLSHENDDLDLTSIHSEDSNGEIQHNSRHHIVNVENHHPLMASEAVNGDLMQDDKEEDVTSIHSADSDGNTPRNTRHHVIHIENDLSITHYEDLIYPSARISNLEEFIEESKMEAEVHSGLDVHNSNCDEDNCRDKSNDTENMIMNVIDAAEKSILQGQVTSASAYQNDPSVFFDCDEYDAALQIQRNDIPVSSLPLTFLTASEPTSPPSNIDDRKAHDTGTFNGSDINSAATPLSTPSEHLFTRLTPVRSNSSRIEDGSNRSSMMETIVGPPLKHKKTGKKLLPRKVASTPRLTERERKAGRSKLDDRKRSKRYSPSEIPVEDDDDDDELSSVSTLEDFEKDESPDMFWIDAFLDFVSPPEDSRSVESDSTTSTTTGSHVLVAQNVDTSTGNTTSTYREPSHKQSRIKKKTPTSLSRLREWWQKELIEEVMKGANAKPLDDSVDEALENRHSNDTVEKLVSKEFHKALHGEKISLLGSRKLANDETKPSMDINPSNWLTILKNTIESATTTGIVCGTAESTLVVQEVGNQQNSSFVAPSYETKSFDSLDNLVQELKRNKVDTDPTALRGHFKSMYEQLQQKLMDAHLFDNGEMPVSQSASIQGTSNSSKEELSKGDVRNDVTRSNTSPISSPEKHARMQPIVEALPDDSLQFLLPSKSSLYSPSTTDYLQPSTVTRISSKGKREKSRKRVATALAKAKTAIAQRRQKTALMLQTESVVGTMGATEVESTGKSFNEPREETEISVSLADLDISMDEPAETSEYDIENIEDDVQVTFHDDIIRFDGSASESCNKSDHNISELGVSGTSNNELCGTEPVHEISHETSVLLENECRLGVGADGQTSEQFSHSIDKNNLTKDTVIDNSGTDESILEIGIVPILLVDNVNPAQDPVTFDQTDPSIDTTIASAADVAGRTSGQRTYSLSTDNTMNNSDFENSHHYHPLDSSAENLTHFGRELALQINVNEVPSNDSYKQYQELTSPEPSDDSLEFITAPDVSSGGKNSRMIRSHSRFTRNTRSLNLRISTALKSDDLSRKKNRLSMKSKAFRRAETYVAMSHSNPIDDSIPGSKDVFHGERSVSTEDPHVIPPIKTDKSVTKLVKNASLLSVLRKKARGAKKEQGKRKQLDDTLMTSLICPENIYGSKDWEEFPTNPFNSNVMRQSTKAEI